MKYALIVLMLLSGFAQAQMEKRLRVLYDREAFRKLAPAVGQTFMGLKLRDLNGKTVDLSAARKRPLVLIGGAYT